MIYVGSCDMDSDEQSSVGKIQWFKMKLWMLQAFIIQCWQSPNMLHVVDFTENNIVCIIPNVVANQASVNVARHSWCLNLIGSECLGQIMKILMCIKLAKLLHVYEYSVCWLCDPLHMYGFHMFHWCIFKVPGPTCNIIGWCEQGHN